MFRFPCARLVASMGAMQGLYVPLEVREAKPDQAQKVIYVYLYKVLDKIPIYVKEYNFEKYWYHT